MRAPAKQVVAELRAPAKVNLTLRVLGRRPDGYHEIDSIMVPVSIYDRLTIRVTSTVGSVVVCRASGPEQVPGDGSNLAARAATAVLAMLGEQARVELDLYKTIPVGAGLGGGSSDAAAVLCALPRLLGRRLGSAERLALATRMGADVPFFLRCRPARARGIGEVLSPLDALAPRTLLVVVPQSRIETAWAYANALPRLTSPRASDSFPRLSLRGGGLEHALVNDFQDGVSREYSDVGRLVAAVESLGATATCMSGSGSAVFGVFASAVEAKQAQREFAAPDKAFVANILFGRPRGLPGKRSRD